MQSTQQREIDGTTFEVSQLDVKVSRAVFVRLGRVLGPALAEFGKVGDVKSLLDVDHSVAFGAISKLLMNASEEDLEFFCQTFMKKSKFIPPEGTGLIGLVDLAFTGRLLTMFKWLAFAIEVNYSDFLDVFKNMTPPTSPKGTGQSQLQFPQA